MQKNGESVSSELNFKVTRVVEVIETVVNVSLCSALVFQAEQIVRRYVEVGCHL